MEWQDFGQKVSLTSRIRELLLNYPEGTSIFKELLQNADDARASSISFCLDYRSHGTDLLPFDQLAPFQGPSLLVHNDAEFTEGDFNSIRHIGDSLKKGQVGKTGRYGLGFNSVYHLTDLPSFVSGKYLVFFDPHCSILPNTSAANPGKRIDFAATDFATAYPDACAAFNAFGCDMSQPFPGTLFRFALRTESMAASSGISKQVYSPQRMRELMQDLQAEAHLLLLFLKSVEQLRIWEWIPGESEPSLLFTCILKNPTSALRRERSLFSRSAQAFSALATSAPLTSGSIAPAETADLQQALKSQDLISSQYHLEVEGRRGNESTSTTWQFVVAQGCSGQTSPAWDLATQLSKDMGAALVPWGAVAAPLDNVSVEQGRVFCFLPLPATSGLPVHINGTFELSSNRRELWHGADLLGVGRQRAAWNATLLSEIIAPLYAQLLVAAAMRLGPTDPFFSLWPESVESLRSKDALAALVNPWLRAIGIAPVAYTRANGGRWLAPEKAIFLDDRAAKNQDLLDALIQLDLPIVTMPPAVTRLLIQEALLQPPLLVPALLREHAQRALPTVLSAKLAATLLEFAASDILEDDEESVKELFGIPLLPLVDGSLASLEPAGRQALFLPSVQETDLFKSAAPFLIDISSLALEVSQKLKVIARMKFSNLSLIEAAVAGKVLLKYALPGCNGIHRKEWDRQTPSPEWLTAFWHWLQEQGGGKALLALTAWPIVPTVSGFLVAPCRIARSTLILPPKHEADWAPGTREGLLKLGCDVVDTSALAAPSLAEAVAHPPTGSGVFCALQNSYAQQQNSGGGVQKWFEAASLDPAEREREALLQLFIQTRWFASGPDRLHPEQLQLLRSLPIFPAAASTAFVDLQGSQRCLPPPDLHSSIAGCERLFKHKSMLVSRGRDADAVLYDHLGVRQLSKSLFYKDFVLPALPALDAKVAEGVAVQMLREVPLLQQADSSILEALRAVPLVTTAGGGIARPDQLYDPRNADLVAFLDPAESFPSGTFGPVLDQLCMLGMRTSAGRDTILHAATRVQELATSESSTIALSRSKALLAYVDAHASQLEAMSSSAAADSSGDRGGFQLDAVFSRVANLLTGEVPLETKNIEKADARGTAEFWEALRAIAWCPVLQSGPLEGMPWHSKVSSVVKSTAEPAAIRTRADLWLASAHCCILDGDVRSPVLLHAMGWASPVPPSVLAKQLAALGTFTHIEDTSTKQILAEVTPQIYRALAKLPKEELLAVRRDLEGAPCIWIGDGFTQVSNVALRGPLNLSSAGIYVIPLELAAFSDVLLALGIPPSFSSTQYISVLATMQAATAGQPLDATRLEQALSVAASLADMSIPAGAVVYLPDERCILREVRQLLYNDAPWAESGIPLEGSTFVHPVISNDVADRLGVASIRRMLLLQGADALPMALTGAAVEAFGQSEALTTRLRHILESYADGPAALMELMQNADDAGATTVRFMLDRSIYPTDRLMGPKLAAWQGPALVAWNDAVFTAADVHNIARIGQDSKLTRPGATGRFGLGFNSTFHWTDLPSFVSGDLLVCFDPHAAFLPGVSPAQPGMKIRFPSSPLLEHFPDSFAPYRVFGCDFSGSYSGTLFRFPLRTPELAATSDIKPRPYTPDDVLGLFNGFRGEAEHALLFLKSLRRVELWSKDSVDSQPALVFSVEAQPRGGAQHPQEIVADFVKSGGGNKDGGFYRKLAKEAALPEACAAVDVRVDERDGSQATVQRWMVCNLLSSGAPLRMALQEQGMQRGWVPWAGVAAAIHPPMRLEGRAFCFLPLPTITTLPVHVNGFFELSSNRRDLWNGTGLSGDAKQRADWNIALVRDGVGAAYVDVLLAATQEGGLVNGEDTAAYYSLWPEPSSLPEPWGVVADAVYELVFNKPILRTRAKGGAWVSPSQAVFVLKSSTTSISSQGLLMEEGLEAKIAAMLLEDGMPIVDSLPSSIAEYLLQRHPALGAAVLTPAFLRRHLKTQTSSLLLRSTSEEGRQSDLDRAACCLEYCLADAPWSSDPKSLADLDGVPLMPMVDGSLGSLSSAVSAQPLLVPAASEHIDHFRSKLAAQMISMRGRDALAQQLAQLAASTNSMNVRMLDAAGVVKYALPAYLPSAWKGKLHVNISSEIFPSKEWIANVWSILASSQPQSPAAVADCTEMLSSWPLIPATRGGEECLSAPHPSSGLVIEGGWTEPAGKALDHLGCAFISPSTTRMLPERLQATCIHPATGHGILSALVHVLKEKTLSEAADELTGDERDGLRAFLLQSRWFEGTVAVEQVAVLRGLPIFRGCGVLSPSTPSQQFTSLLDGEYFTAPQGFRPLSSLPENFIQAAPGEADVLKKVLGIEECGEEDALLKHALPRAAQLDTASLDALLWPLLRQVTSGQCPPAVFAALRDTACVPVGSLECRRCVAPGECFDPRNEGLKELVGADAAFPMDTWAAEENILSALALLGMRTTVNAETLLGIAQQLHGDVEGDTIPREALDRRARALFTALDALVIAQETAAAQEDGQCAQQPADLWEQIQQLTFVPVHTKPPVEGLPWPDGGSLNALAAPRQVRREADAWLVSASLHLLCVPCSDVLAEKLCISAPISPKVLAAQLLGLGHTHSSVNNDDLRGTVQNAAAELYDKLDDPTVLSGPMGEIVFSLLKGGATVWVGDGFALPSQVAIETSMDLTPYIHAVPQPLAAKHAALFAAIGVPPTPTPLQYVEALQCMAQKHGIEDALSPHDLTTALAIAECLGTALAAGAKRNAALSSEAMLPDADGCFAQASALYINDAPWLAHEDLRMVHPDVPAEAAAALGAQSLRFHHQVETQTSERLPCPPAALLRQLLASQADPALLALSDMLEVADACGCSRFEVHLDTRFHGSQSVLQSGLAAFQGPALCIKLPGVVLSPEELCRLQSPPTPFRMRQNLCRFGCGMLNAYLISDVVQVIAGDSFFVFDPSAHHLALEASPASSTQDTPPVRGHAKQYRHIGTDLIRRFSDQFSVWDWAGEDIHSSIKCTLLRFPLRSAQQAQQPHALSKTSWDVASALALVSSLTASVSQCLLFTNSLMTINILQHDAASDATLLHGATIELPLTVGSVGQPHSHRSWVEESEWRQKSKGPGGFLGLGALSKQFGWLGGKEDVTSSRKAAEEKESYAKRFVEHSVSICSGPVSGKQQQRSEQWVVAVCAGAGGSGSMAADKRYQHLNLTPQAAVAVKLSVERGSRASIDACPGLLATLPLAASSIQADAMSLSRLPFSVCAQFALARAGGRRATEAQPALPPASDGSTASETTDHAKGRFNAGLLTCIGLAAVDLLEKLVLQHQSLDCRGLYDMLPFSVLPATDTPSDVAAICKQMSKSVAKKRLWKLHRGNQVALLHQGCFLESTSALGTLSTAAGAFLQERLPLFQAPQEVLPWMEAWGVEGIRRISPSVVRMELKTLAATQALTQGGLFTPAVAVELLLFATSDVTVSPGDDGVTTTNGTEAEAPGGAIDLDALAHCKGLPCLDATGAVQILGSRTLYVLEPGKPDPTTLFASHPGLLRDFIHPEIAVGMAPLVQRSAVTAAIGVKTYSLEHVPLHLAQILPSHWAPVGIGGDAPMAVRWRDGQAGGPTPAWMQQLWAFLLSWGGLTQAVFDPLAGWTLLPLCGGDVARIAFRHVIITPPLENNASLMDADASPIFAEAWQSHLVPALQEIGCFVLDPRFSACSDVCNSPYSDNNGAEQGEEDVLLVQKMRATHDLGQLRVAGASPLGRKALLEWLAHRADTPDASTALRSVDIEFLRNLPLYPTLGDGVAALEGGPTAAQGAVEAEVLATVAGHETALPPGLMQQLLKCTPEFSRLYNSLGVQLLTTSKLLAIVLRWEGGFSSLPAPTQQACIQVIESQWAELQDDYACTLSMASTAFVSTVDGGLAAPKELYDPTLPLLATAFAGQPVFPHGRFSSAQWLDILRTLGMRRSLDRPTFLGAARRVANQARQLCNKNTAGGGGRILAQAGQLLDGEAAQTWEAASSLARHLADSEGGNLLSGGEGRKFAQELRQVAFVPAKLYTAGVATAASTLASFEELVLPSDAPLAWTSAPVLDATAAPSPPANAHAALRIRSPPPFDSVAAHLMRTGKLGGDAVLACWPFPDHTPAESCHRVLKYLDDEGLSARQLERLKSVPLVPVGNGAHLVAPDTLFLRTPMDARPLLYELPPVFVPNLVVLKLLGLRDAPSAGDMLACVRAMPMNRRLPTPQLLAVTRILKHLLVESPAPEALAAAGRGDIAVPNAYGIMTLPHACCWADASLWDTVPRLAGTRISVSHPLVPAAVCKAVRIPSLADVVEERLDAGHEERVVVEIQNMTPAEVAARLREPCVIKAVHSALQSQRRALASSDTQAYGGVGATSSEEVGSLLDKAASGLRFVQACHTVLQLSGGDSAQYLEGTASQVSCYADPGCIVIAAEPPAAVSAVLAAAVSKCFKAPALLPIAPLFAVPANLLSATAELISGSQDAGSRTSAGPILEESLPDASASALSLAMSAGQLGAPLTPGDFAAARLLPLRRYAAGELVAVRMPTGQLRYARVSADSGPPAGAAAYKATLEIAPGKFHDVLSTEIMGFSGNGENIDEESISSTESPSAEGRALAGLSGPLATGLPGSINSGNSSEFITPSPPARPSAASPAEIVDAVRSMLTAAGVPLDPGSSDLLQQSLVLRQQLQSTKQLLDSSMLDKAKVEEDAAQVRAAWQCRICLQREVDTVMVGCGHVLCQECAAALPRRSCPFCRTPSQMTRLYR